MRVAKYFLSLMLLCLLAAPAVSLGDDAVEQNWSEPVNGIQARMTLKQTSVVNGTPIVSAYLTLRSVGKIVNPQMVQWASEKLAVQLVDEQGKEVAQAFGPYSGGRRFSADLVLPFDSELTFNVSQSGFGISKDKAALLDFGAQHCWVIDAADGKEYFLTAKFVVPKPPRRSGFVQTWHGTIEIPKAKLPLGK